MARILFVNRFFSPDYSATSQLLSDLAFLLASDGREVHVVTSLLLYDAPGASLLPLEGVRGVTVHRVWTSTFGRGSLLGRAFDYLTFYISSTFEIVKLSSRGDLIIAMTDPPLLSLVARPAAWATGAKLVNWLQDLFPEVAALSGMGWSGGIVGKAIALLRDRTLRDAEVNVVLGVTMEKYLHSRRIPADRVCVIPNWSDGASVKPLAADHNPLRRSWGLEGKFVVGYSGNMGRAHEFETVLQAAARLNHRSDIVFLFIGGGAQRKWIEDRARQLALRNITFRSYQPREELTLSLSVPDVHLVTLLPGIESFVFPSKLYGILAAGRPVLFVGAAGGEIPSLLIQGRIGYAIKCGNVAELEERILSFATNLARTKEMGEHARMLFEQRFVSRISLQKWAQLIDSVASRHNGSPSRAM